MKPIPLAVDGANPLGFLAALGAAQLLAERNGEKGPPDVRLSWNEARQPVLVAPGVEDGEALIKLLTDLAVRPAADTTAVKCEKKAQALFEAARRKDRKKRDEIRKRHLPRDQRKAALAAEHAPLAQETASLRAEWRTARAKAAPDPTVSMGLDLNVKSEEFADHCCDALVLATPASRRWIDFCACFGIDSGNERMDATPFALISGSGHQHFLGTAGDLMVACTTDHFRNALFGSWAATDDGSSFRWDPDDDRRYALLADDPTASGNKPKTIWGANRLAFEALRLFPCVRGRAGASTVGWRRYGESEVWRWPLWACNLSLAVISSVLASRDMWRDEPESRRRLRARGVFAVFQTRRIAVGRAPNQKLNFTPSAPVWWSPQPSGGALDGS
jgi:hypothetical protein